MLKYTLVPEEFFSPETASDLLGRVAQVGGDEHVKYQELPQYKAVLVYVDSPSIGDLFYMLTASASITTYNKIVVRYAAAQASDPAEPGRIDIVLVSGKNLKLVNSYRAPDPVTAEYYIYAVLRQFQINPVQTPIYFFGDAPVSLKEDLFRHFASVESL